MCSQAKRSSARIVLGPELHGWGSWHWVGSDLQDELSKFYETAVYREQMPPKCDVVVVVKHAPARQWVEEVGRRAAVLYCPVDFYGSAADIDADAAMLRKCTRVVVHCERLRRYLEPYAPVEYLDHHVKFIGPLRQDVRAEGFFLWVGVRTNLAPLVQWVNAHPLSGELRILTNLEDPRHVPTPAELGFRAEQVVRVEDWSPELHRRRLAEARAALDIKGDDFRSRHKPPAKALDFIASGVPLAMNPESSPVEHLARMGFVVPSPLEVERWLSREYAEETRRFGGAPRELLARERAGLRWKRLIDEVLAEKK